MSLTMIKFFAFDATGVLVSNMTRSAHWSKSYWKDAKRIGRKQTMLLVSFLAAH